MSSGIRGNRLYHDPALGAAFSNLAQAFAPPSAGDIAAYATASATREKAARLAQLFSEAASFDERNIAAGNYNYAGSRYAVDLNNDTTRRGQDVAARTSIFNNNTDNATARYGYDSQATTSRANNTYTTDANNTRALQERRMAEAAAMERQLAQPAQVSAGETYVPSLAQIAAGQFTGPIQGGVALNPGETFTPSPRIGGPVLQGAPKPLTDAELKAQILGRLPQSEQRAVALQGVDVEQVMRPDGQGVETVFRPDAVGRTPYVNPGATAKPTNGEAVYPDGTRVTAVQDLSSGAWKSAENGQPLAPGYRITDLPKPQGSNSDLEVSTKTNLTRARQIEGDVTNMNGLVGEIESLVKNNPAATGLAGDVLSFAQDARQVINEFDQVFGGDKNTPVTVADIKTIADRALPKTGPYNPVYRQARGLLLELAYANAKLNNNGGEVSRFALERELENLGQGVAGNDQGVLAATANARSRMVRALETAKVLAGERAAPTSDQVRTPPPAAVPTPPPNSGAPAPSAEERWERDANGKMRKVQ